MIHWPSILPWIASVGTIVTALAAGLAAINAISARRHSQKDIETTKAVSHQITSLEVSFNHRLDALIEAKENAARAEGITQGIAQEQARQSIKDAARAEGIVEAQVEAAQKKP